MQRELKARKEDKRSTKKYKDTGRGKSMKRRAGTGFGGENKLEVKGLFGTKSEKIN